MKLAFSSPHVLLKASIRRASSFLGHRIATESSILTRRCAAHRYRVRTIASLQLKNTPESDTTDHLTNRSTATDQPQITLPSPISSETELRSHTCGQLRTADIGRTVRLHGWAHAVRDRGGVLFVLVRDRYGIIQVTFGDQSPAEIVEIAKSIRLEYVIDVTGTVSSRDPAVVNPAMPTGEIEVIASDVRIVSRTKPMPFMIADQGKDTKEKTKDAKKNVAADSTGASDDTKLKYRYLDLRRPALQQNFIMRHQATLAVRKYLDASGFLEVETPILTKATPEGARDYLVPSRVHAGSWYALPQSPQIYKQLLMVSGFDRYFQITKCFRDEDLRQDRQPEFTQIDLEMSFVERTNVLSVAEGIIRSMFASVLKEEIGQIPRITYAEAMDRFGVDAPDMRFGMELQNVTLDPLIQTSSFAPIRSAIDQDGIVKLFVVRDAAKSTSRKILDAYVTYVKSYGLSGLLYGKVTEDSVSGPMTKICDDSEALQSFVNDKIDAKPGDLVLIATGKASTVNAGLGKLRVKIGNESGLIAKGSRHAFCWVVDFPLLEFDEDLNRYISVHHPFTSPLKSQLHLLDDESSLGDIKSDAYDLVCNGSEIGGGSIRIHDPVVQQKVFRALGINEDEQKDKFGFLLDALSYGAPPHGGLAFGLDRCLMIMSGSESIRDVVAFPKTTSASDIMAGAPAPVPEHQLDELNVRSISTES